MPRSSLPNSLAAVSISLSLSFCFPLWLRELNENENPPPEIHLTQFSVDICDFQAEIDREIDANKSMKNV